jgi:hypothetical protein
MEVTITKELSMHDQITRLLGMMEVMRLPAKIAAKNKQRLLAGKCLAPECENDVWRRGLCAKCYQRFLRQRNSRKGAKRAEYEIKCVKAGLILPIGEAAKIKTNNPFAKVG